VHGAGAQGCEDRSVGSAPLIAKLQIANFRLPIADLVTFRAIAVLTQ
jgi:hypothetical protein